ncbi:MAG: DNA helicase RecQ [Saprospirales bacterium]|nr:DNA helicase RecQ [Saprospirales bacterium]
MEMVKAHEALKQYFGFDSFRPLQAEIIQRVLSGKDSIVLMPTGGGKSICYQLPAILMPGTCIVVSPLISLMKDQVEALWGNGVKASFLNSTLDPMEQRMVEEELFQGAIDLLYVSPERLTSNEFLPLLRRAKVNMVAIDEAHCISSWGHDFRPEYTQLKFLKKELPGVPLMALTATADRLTRMDIAEQLALDDPELFLASFDRPNLSLEVRPGQDRLGQIAAFVKQRPGQPGIIYCLSRKSTEQVAAGLQARGINAGFYHAGMNDKDRSAAQEDFINDRITVIAATVAFGMGIDKSNVRFVMHYNLPKNIESYYQEIGRAGRDGVKAETVLFYSYADVSLLQDILKQEEGEQTEINLVKLERMYQYATGQQCRRQILLSYFGEDLREKCGNCDICLKPPQYFEGTVLAQKALSAIARVNEKVGMNMLIDILRGSGKQEIYDRGYHQIKTFGAGRDLSYLDWRQYFEQFLNQGLIEVAHEEFGQLRLTNAGKEVLFNGRQVELVQARAIREKRSKPQRTLSKREQLREGLFQDLKKLRLEIARKNGLPPYIVFNDATLEEMAEKKPLTDEELKEITGVGERKLHLYGNQFLDLIRAFVLEKKEEGFSVTGATYLESFTLFKQGLSVEEIAEKKEISVARVYDHLYHFMEKGEVVDTDRLIQPDEVQQVLDLAQRQKEEPFTLKPIFEALNGAVPYHKIRLALYIGEKELK